MRLTQTQIEIVCRLACQTAEEWVATFVSRFSCLQDTPGVRAASVIDKLEHAERLEWLVSSEEWLAIRNLRDQMVHEYVEDAGLLMCVQRSTHKFVPGLTATADKMFFEIQSRALA